MDPSQELALLKQLNMEMRQKNFILQRRCDDLETCLQNISLRIQQSISHPITTDASVKHSESTPNFSSIGC